MDVDYLAGNVGVFRFIYGKATGFRDGFADVAEFSYPVSIAFNRAVSSPNGGVSMYVVDSQNSAIRLVQSITNTPSPSAQPSVSMAPSQPTVSPTSGQPTLAPSPAPSTATPSAVPTLSPTLSQAPTKFVPPTSAPTELHGECLIITLIDSFGDGWSGSVLRVEAPGHVPSELTFEPSEANPFEVTLCSSYLRSDNFGLYSMAIVTPDRKEAQNLWEIQWKVLIESSGQEFSGDVDTSIIFNFDSDTGFTFVDSSNIVDSSKLSCERCKHPKPKPSKDSAALDSRELLPGTPPPPPPPKPPKIKYEVPFVLHDEGGNGWFHSSGEGSRFYVIDSSHTDLISTGTLCGSRLKDDCAVDLPDGDYYFRVDGAVNPDARDVAWTFCKQRGKAQQELSFSVVDGECVSGALRDASVLAYASTSTQVSLAGHILVANVFGSSFSFDDNLLVEDAVLFVLSDGGKFSGVEVLVSSSCSSKTGKFCADERPTKVKGAEVDRLLPAAPSPLPKGTSTWDLSLLVTIVAERNGADGTKYSEVNEISDRLRAIATDSVLQGRLQDRIQSLADARSSTSLKYVHVKEEKPLSLVHINYVSTATPSAAPTEGEGTGLLSSMEIIQVVNDSGMQVLLIGIVVGLPTIGLIAFWSLRRSVDAVEGKSSGEEGPVEVARGAWQEAVLKESLAGRQTLPSPCHGKRASNTSVDDLLAIPGRTQARAMPAPVVPAKEDARRNKSIDAQINPSRLSSNRDRFRVREGLAHHDLAPGAVRAGLSEQDKVLL